MYESCININEFIIRHSWGKIETFQVEMVVLFGKDSI